MRIKNDIQIEFSDDAFRKFVEGVILLWGFVY